MGGHTEVARVLYSLLFIFGWKQYAVDRIVCRFHVTQFSRCWRLCVPLHADSGHYSIKIKVLCASAAINFDAFWWMSLSKAKPKIQLLNSDRLLDCERLVTNLEWNTFLIRNISCDEIPLAVMDTCIVHMRQEHRFHRHFSEIGCRRIHAMMWWRQTHVVRAIRNHNNNNNNVIELFFVCVCCTQTISLKESKLNSGSQSSFGRCFFIYLFARPSIRDSPALDALAVVCRVFHPIQWEAMRKRGILCAILFIKYTQAAHLLDINGISSFLNSI